MPVHIPEAALAYIAHFEFYSVLFAMLSSKVKVIVILILKSHDERLFENGAGIALISSMSLLHVLTKE